MTDIIERLRSFDTTDDRECPYTDCGPLMREAADEIGQLRAAAKPFADYDWYDAELEDDNCQLVRHSGPITVGHWRALRTALGMKP